MNVEHSTDADLPKSVREIEALSFIRRPDPSLVKAELTRLDSLRKSGQIGEEVYVRAMEVLDSALGQSRLCVVDSSNRSESFAE